MSKSEGQNFVVMAVPGPTIKVKADFLKHKGNPDALKRILDDAKELNVTYDKNIFTQDEVEVDSEKKNGLYNVLSEKRKVKKTNER